MAVGDFAGDDTVELERLILVAVGVVFSAISLIFWCIWFVRKFQVQQKCCETVSFSPFDGPRSGHNEPVPLSSRALRDSEDGLTPTSRDWREPPNGSRLISFQQHGTPGQRQLPSAFSPLGATGSDDGSGSGSRHSGNPLAHETGSPGGRAHRVSFKEPSQRKPVLNPSVRPPPPRPTLAATQVKLAPGPRSGTGTGDLRMPSQSAMPPSRRPPPAPGGFRASDAFAVHGMGDLIDRTTTDTMPRQESSLPNSVSGLSDASMSSQTPFGASGTGAPLTKSKSDKTFSRQESSGLAAFGRQESWGVHKSRHTTRGGLSGYNKAGGKKTKKGDSGEVGSPRVSRGTLAQRIQGGAGSPQHNALLRKQAAYNMSGFKAKADEDESSETSEEAQEEDVTVDVAEISQRPGHRPGQSPTAKFGRDAARQRAQTVNKMQSAAPGLGRSVAARGRGSSNPTTPMDDSDSSGPDAQPAPESPAHGGRDSSSSAGLTGGSSGGASQNPRRFTLFS